MLTNSGLRSSRRARMTANRWLNETRVTAVAAMWKSYGGGFRNGGKRGQLHGVFGPCILLFLAKTSQP